MNQSEFDQPMSDFQQALVFKLKSFEQNSRSKKEVVQPPSTGRSFGDAKVNISRETLANPKHSGGNSMQEELSRRRVNLRRTGSLARLEDAGSRSNDSVRMGGTLDRRGRRETNAELAPPPLVPKKQKPPTKVKSTAKPTSNMRGIDGKMDGDNEGRGRPKREQKRSTVSDIASKLSNVGIPSTGSPAELDSVPVPMPYHQRDSNLEEESSNPTNTNLEEHTQNQELAPPAIPKRIQSYRPTRNQIETITPQNEQRLDQPRRREERGGSPRRGGGGRWKEDRSPVPGKVSAITPVGSSSESDYSGDGYVRLVPCGVCHVIHSLVHVTHHDSMQHDGLSLYPVIIMDMLEQHFRGSC